MPKSHSSSYPHPETHLQHVEQRGLAGIIETKEQELGVLVQEAERGQDIVD